MITRIDGEGLVDVASRTGYPKNLNTVLDTDELEEFYSMTKSL